MATVTNRSRMPCHVTCCSKASAAEGLCRKITSGTEQRIMEYETLVICTTAGIPPRKREIRVTYFMTKKVLGYLPYTVSWHQRNPNRIIPDVTHYFIHVRARGLHCCQESFIVGWPARIFDWDNNWFLVRTAPFQMEVQKAVQKFVQSRLLFPLPYVALAWHPPERRMYDSLAR